MNQTPAVHIVTNQLPFFCRLLAGGIFATTTSGTSIHDYLADDMGIPPDYIRNRIQTIFLDGKAVDDVNATIIKKDATLALSAAMPGLVGATFRKSGYYSTLRKTISHDRRAATSSRQPIPFTLKLFNTIAGELGPELFTKGIQVSGTAFQDFIQYQKERFESACSSLTVDGKKLKVDDLLTDRWKTDWVHLSVTEKTASSKPVVNRRPIPSENQQSPD